MHVLRTRIRGIDMSKIVVNTGLAIRVITGIIALFFVFINVLLACIAYTRGLYDSMVILGGLALLASYSFILTMTSYDEDKDIITILLVIISFPYIAFLIEQAVKFLNNL